MRFWEGRTDAEVIWLVAGVVLPVLFVVATLTTVRSLIKAARYRRRLARRQAVAAGSDQLVAGRGHLLAGAVRLVRRPRRAVVDLEDDDPTEQATDVEVADDGTLVLDDDRVE